MDNLNSFAISAERRSKAEDRHSQLHSVGQIRQGVLLSRIPLQSMPEKAQYAANEVMSLDLQLQFRNGHATTIN